MQTFEDVFNSVQKSLMEYSGIGAPVAVGDSDKLRDTNGNTVGEWKVLEESPVTVEQLRKDGHAVIIWTPEELGDASPNRVEDRLCELGWDVISDLGGPEPTDDEDEDDPVVV